VVGCRSSAASVRGTIEIGIRGLLVLTSTAILLRS
jgi:hypothetical protein